MKKLMLKMFYLLCLLALDIGVARAAVTRGGVTLRVIPRGRPSGKNIRIQEKGIQDLLPDLQLALRFKNNDIDMLEIWGDIKDNIYMLSDLASDPYFIMSKEWQKTSSALKDDIAAKMREIGVDEEDIEHFRRGLASCKGVQSWKDLTKKVQDRLIAKAVKAEQLLEEYAASALAAPEKITYSLEQVGQPVKVERSI